MSNRGSKRNRVGSFKHKKGNTPYKSYYDREKIIKARIECQFIPFEDYKHLQSITGPDRTVGVIE